eukprot:365447-Chlamydomonas_euryale.AAC.14
MQTICGFAPCYSDSASAVWYPACSWYSAAQRMCWRSTCSVCYLQEACLPSPLSAPNTCLSAPNTRSQHLPACQLPTPHLRCAAQLSRLPLAQFASLPIPDNSVGSRPHQDGGADDSRFRSRPYQINGAADAAHASPKLPTGTATKHPHAAAGTQSTPAGVQTLGATEGLPMPDAPADAPQVRHVRDGRPRASNSFGSPEGVWT